ncbi:MAG: hypothetical protein QM779_06805 [Propionicimonas sp.]
MQTTIPAARKTLRRRVMAARYLRMVDRVGVAVASAAGEFDRGHRQGQLF